MSHIPFNSCLSFVGLYLYLQVVRSIADCVRIKQAEKQYMDAFNDELESFKDRIRKRAQVKIEEAMRQVEEVRRP